MGIRGPRAKPVRLEIVRTNEARRRPRWKARRLTRAQRVIRFIEGLPCTQGYGAGGPLWMHGFQQEILEAIYAVRPVRTALVTMPRKNGKSTSTAGLCCNALVGRETIERGQILSAACDRQQAGIIFNEIVAMIDRRPSIAERLHVQRWNKTVTDTITGSVYQALSADSRKAHGLTRAWWSVTSSRSGDRRSCTTTSGPAWAGASGRLMVVISTRSADPNHIMSELVRYGENVRDGVIDDPTFAPVIYAAPEDADWLDEFVWRACNPAIDAGFRSIEKMRVAAAQAQRMPAREAVFRNLYLNQAVDTRSDRFIPLPEWQACEGVVDPDALRGRPCWGGLDLSSTQDLTSLVLYFPEDGGAVLPWFWAPRDRLQARQDGDKAPYVTWHAQGLLEAPSGRAIDRYAIARRLGEIAGIYDVRSIAYDRWRIEDLQHVLSDEGIT